MSANLAIDIRPLSQLAEFSEVVRLQRLIWGFDEVDLLPLRLFVVAGKIGGQLLGAFDRGEMIAFCLCIPGIKPGGKSYLHSHMLGVLPAYRNSGVGRRLKLAQREYALSVKVDLIEWTFDPLELKNAFFNIERLGAVVRRYVHNQYGTTSSHLHGGLPTDRLIPEWYIASERVQARLDGKEDERRTAEARIAVPSAISEIRGSDPVLAREIQSSLAEQFERCFREDLTVVGLERGEEWSTYLLSPYPVHQS